MANKLVLLLKTHIFSVLMLLLVGLNESCSKKSSDAPGTPTISSFTPSSGSRGQFVKINGQNFSSIAQENQVTFNGIPTSVLSATLTSLVVLVPPSPGIGKISVEVNGRKVSSGSNFNYVQALSTLAGDGLYGSRDGQGKSAEFYLPYGAGLDASGNIYIADQGNSLIRKITPGGLVTTIAGTGTPGYLDGNALQAQFNRPNDVAADAAGNLYVTDANRIRKISAAGIVSTLAGNDAAAFADGSGTAARFNTPSCIAVDASGNVLVADAGNNKIRKISPAGSVTTIAGSGAAGYLDGSASDAKFSYPVAIAIDASGNIYIGDLQNQRIRKISAGGAVSTLAGDGNYGFKDGDPGSAEFGTTLGISVDATGNVYVADGDNNRIRKITPTGAVSTLVGDGNPGGNEAPITSAEIHIPSDILIANNGIFYVVDYFNNRICKIQ